MKFTESPLQDAWILEIEPRGDERGYFARTFCRKELEAHGLDATIVQSNSSYSRDAGTLRGMHYQKAPAEETKLIRCLRGSIFDVIIDLRPDSSTYLQSYGIELTADNLRMLYIPKGFAHGFMTLQDTLRCCTWSVNIIRPIVKMAYATTIRSLISNGRLSHRWFQKKIRTGPILWHHNNRHTQ